MFKTTGDPKMMNKPPKSSVKFNVDNSLSYRESAIYVTDFVITRIWVMFFT